MTSGSELGCGGRDGLDPWKRIPDFVGLRVERRRKARGRESCRRINHCKVVMGSGRVEEGICQSDCLLTARPIA